MHSGFCVNYRRRPVSVFEYDTAVSGILADELPYYFAEEQSAGQIADRIQRRVQLYLEETRR